MDSELIQLETQFARMVERINSLDKQNSRLVAALSAALQENAELRFGLENAKMDLATLLDKLPKEGCVEWLNQLK